MSEPPSQCLQQVALDLSSAFLNFFEKRAQYPNFKKKGNRQSIRFPQHVKFDGDHLTLPKIGLVYCKVSRLPLGRLKSVTVSSTPSGEFYACCLYDDGKEQPVSTEKGKAIGLDLGLTHFVITSDGTKHGSPKYYRKYEDKLAKKQKQLSRKQKGSGNRSKARKQVAKVHQKITRCREDFLHKLSRNLVDKNQVIVVENLAVKNMVIDRRSARRVNHKLAIDALSASARRVAISDARWSQFCTMLKYKAEWEGKVYIEVDRFYPSSKTCNKCLHQVKEMSLSVRTFYCQQCHTVHDRDINAACNIRDEGLRILLAVGTTVKASGLPFGLTSSTSKTK